MTNLLTMERITTANSTFAIGGVSCSADSLVAAESFVLRINISSKNPAHRKSANRYAALLEILIPIEFFFRNLVFMLTLLTFGVSI